MAVSTDAILSVLLGLGLSAACGFRVFVPLLVLNLAVRAGWVSIAPELAWLGGTPALVAFGVATGLEIIAYYVPVLDHALDTVATPAAVVAGIVAAASVITGMDPAFRWVLAIIAGGVVAGTVQSATVGGRLLSTLSTGGLTNPIVATLELGSSFLMSILALVMPALAALVVAVLAIWIVRRRRRVSGARTLPGRGSR